MSTCSYFNKSGALAPSIFGTSSMRQSIDDMKDFTGSTMALYTPGQKLWHKCWRAVSLLVKLLNSIGPIYTF